MELSAAGSPYLSPWTLAQSVAAPAWLNAPTMILVGVVLGLLGIATVVGQILLRQPDTYINPAMVQKFNLRLRAWWGMCAILAAAFIFLHPAAVTFLFFLLSFWALREFITLTPTRLGDHRALFYVFFLFTPLQYVLVGLGKEYHGLYTVLIPVFAFLFVPARVALAGDYKRFLERTAKIQAGLLVCVFALSFAPAVLYLELGEPGSRAELWRGSNAGLLFYFILVVQLGDVFQYVWDQLLGRRLVAPSINASKTWEGLLGSIASSALLGFALYWATPFGVFGSAAMSMVMAVMGFAGSITMSAIKRDRGVKDYGTLVEGHAGVLDRIDSICFAAPVFFHLTWYFCSLARLPESGPPEVPLPPPMPPMP
jgi:phosphatidate cytidylyltransferase